MAIAVSSTEAESVEAAATAAGLLSLLEDPGARGALTPDQWGQVVGRATWGDRDRERRLGEIGRGNVPNEVP